METKKLKNIFRMGLLAFVVQTLLAGTALAQEHYDLATLDVLKTCTPGTEKEVIGKMTLSYLHAFATWQMKEQMQMIHPDFISWHSSLAGLLVAKPELQDKVPFKRGQWDKDSYIATMAFLATFNEITRYVTKPLRVDCVGNDSAVIVAQFDGFQVYRDEKGCVTHGLEFGSPVKISVDFKDFKTGENSPVRKLVYRTYSHLDDTVSTKVREEMAKIIQGPPNVPYNPASCKTYSQILKEFQDQLLED